MGELIFGDCTTTWFPRAQEQVGNQPRRRHGGFHMNVICPEKIVPFQVPLSYEELKK